MRFKGLDLNLLAVFDTLMTTRSVSRAAEQLNLSQPAISSALKRLRDYFDDDILAAHGKRMLPTAHAESLWPQVRESLGAIEALIATSSRFDPLTSHRTFRICSSDYIAAALLAPLARALARSAPNVRLELLFSDDESFARLEQGAVDLLVVPDGFIRRDLPAEFLLEERYVVVGWRDNPLFAAPLSEAAFMAAGHVQVAIGYQRTPVFSTRELALHGRVLRTEAIVSSFTMIPWLLVGTDRIALMHERLALGVTAHQPLAIAEVPFAFPPMREMVQFHPARAADPGLVWLRESLATQAALTINCSDAMQ